MDTIAFEEKQPRTGNLTVNDALNDDINLIENFIRSEMKSVMENTEDTELENLVSKARLPFDAVRRLYMQDYYPYLMENDYLYNLLKCEPVDNEISSDTVIGTNNVKISFNEKDFPNLTNMINDKLATIRPCEIDESHFHSTIEFADLTNNIKAIRVECFDFQKLSCISDKFLQTLLKFYCCRPRKCKHQKLLVLNIFHQKQRCKFMNKHTGFATTRTCCGHNMRRCAVVDYLFLRNRQCIKQFAVFFGSYITLYLF